MISCHGAAWRTPEAAAICIRVLHVDASQFIDVAVSLALGSIADREAVIEELEALPQAKPASHAEVMAMIEWLGLFNCGIGYVDAHLLAAVRQLPNGRIWTRDKKLLVQAERLGVAFDE